MFRDSGRYPTFFPSPDNILGDARLLNEYPDLERHEDGGLVKHSLFNVFKILRPVVVLDEAHKAYGAKKRESNEEFARSISRLDPSLVIELSATPNRGISNLLVDIEGPDLKKEQMIKLPVQVIAFPNAEWQLTLAQALMNWRTLIRKRRRLSIAQDGISGRSALCVWSERAEISAMASVCMPRMCGSISSKI